MSVTKGIVGIDLGTSNCAVATIASGATVPVLLDVPQLESVGVQGSGRLLPSVAYLPLEGELASSAPVIGRFARDRAATLPDRAIVSAKSWLCHGGVDRRAPILPWKAEMASGKRSPVEVSTLFLRHLREAYLAQGGAEDAEVVLTVPASFDEAARNLTSEAAEAAGWGQATLLEEPLAALYSWIFATGEGGFGLRAALSPGDLVLVCDVGGGTTDLSLVAVAEDAGELRLERISVGEHLLLGGDNMDLALAYTLKARLAAEGRQLDHWQFLSLTAAARQAKERLLAENAPPEVSVSVASRGASLFAQTISTTLTQADVEKVIVDGFFPLTGPGDLPAARRGTGLFELGLPYEAEAAVSRHLARFLAASRRNAQSSPELARLIRERLSASRDGGPLLPTAILFNGGVFNAKMLRERVLSLLSGWGEGAPMKELASPASADFDLAVAVGAAAYGSLRQTGKGLRIRSGTARSYYLGIESPVPAVPGIEPPVRGLCVVPQGTEEGTRLPFPSQRFGLVVGEPAEFRFFASSERAGDAVGSTVEDAARALVETARLGATLPAGERPAGTLVPVTLEAEVTELGTLRLALRETPGDGRWQLEFDVRGVEPS